MLLIEYDNVGIIVSINFVSNDKDSTSKFNEYVVQKLLANTFAIVLFSLKSSILVILKIIVQKAKSVAPSILNNLVQNVYNNNNISILNISMIIVSKGKDLFPKITKHSIHIKHKMITISLIFKTLFITMLELEKFS